MSPRPPPTLALFDDETPVIRAPRAVSYVAAYAWWSLKTHVAEANGLPRDSAGPEPKWRCGRL